MWTPRLFERDKYAGWLAKGMHSLAARASALVDEQLEAPASVSLTGATDEVLATIVDEAEARTHVG